jgi:hypothetical protein
MFNEIPNLLELRSPTEAVNARMKAASQQAIQEANSQAAIAGKWTSSHGQEALQQQREMQAIAKAQGIKVKHRYD